MFLNHYQCPRCDHAWSDEWSCQCDDDCPACGLRHLSPIDSEDVDDADADAGTDTEHAEPDHAPAPLC